MMAHQARQETPDTLGRARTAVAFVHRSPDLVLMLDGRGGATQATWDTLEPTPDLVFEFPDAETAHRFWLGELDVMTALRERRLTMRGNVLKALALLPSSRSNAAAFRAALDEEDAPA